MVLNVGVQGSDAAFFSKALTENLGTSGGNSEQILLRYLQHLLGSKHIEVMTLLSKPAHTSSAIQGYVKRNIESCSDWLRGKVTYDYFRSCR